MRKAFWLLYVAMMALVLSSCTFDFSSCEHGEKKCNGDKLFSCSHDGNWLETLTCSSNQFCNTDVGCAECRDNDDCKNISEPVCNLTMKSCQSVDAICGKAEVQCEGTTSKACNAAQNGFDETNCVEPRPKCAVNKGCVECANDVDCKDPKPLCNLNKNKCQRRDAVCSEGETRCEKDSFLSCNAAASGFDSQQCFVPRHICDYKLGCVECRNAGDCKDDTKPECNITTNSCQAVSVVCIKGVKKCENDLLYTCKADQSSFEVTPCATTKPHCDVDMGCVECRNSNDCKQIKPFCDMKTKACKDNDSNKCTAGHTTCDGKFFMTCKMGEWLPIDTCNEPGEICDPDKGCVFDQ